MSPRDPVAGDAFSSESTSIRDQHRKHRKQWANRTCLGHTKCLLHVSTISTTFLGSNLICSTSLSECCNLTSNLCGEALRLDTPKPSPTGFRMLKGPLVSSPIAIHYQLLRDLLSTYNHVQDHRGVLPSIMHLQFVITCIQLSTYDLQSLDITSQFIPKYV